MPPQTRKSNPSTAALNSDDDNDNLTTGHENDGVDNDVGFRPITIESELLRIINNIRSFFERYPWVLLLAVWCIAVPAHETRPFSAGAVTISAVIVHYVCNSATKDQVFRSMFRFLLLKMPLYLAVGALWSVMALYLNIWRGHLPKSIVDNVITCSGDHACLLSVLPSLKGYIYTYIVHWPFSVTMFVLRDPVYMALDFIWIYLRGMYVRAMVAGASMVIGDQPASHMHA